MTMSLINCLFFALSLGCFSNCVKAELPIPRPFQMPVKESAYEVPIETGYLEIADDINNLLQNDGNGLGLLTSYDAPIIPSTNNYPSQFIYHTGAPSENIPTNSNSYNAPVPTSNYNNPSGSTENNEKYNLEQFPPYLGNDGGINGIGDLNTPQGYLPPSGGQNSETSQNYDVNGGYTY